MGKVSVLISALFNTFYQWLSGNIVSKVWKWHEIGGIYNVMTTRQCGLLSDLG